MSASLHGFWGPHVGGSLANFLSIWIGVTSTALILLGGDIEVWVPNLVGGRCWCCNCKGCVCLIWYTWSLAGGSSKDLVDLLASEMFVCWLDWLRGFQFRLFWACCSGTCKNMFAHLLQVMCVSYSVSWLLTGQEFTSPLKLVAWSRHEWIW